MDNARRIFDAARHPKSFIALDGADHLLTKPADATFAAGMLTHMADVRWDGLIVGGVLLIEIGAHA